MSWEVKPLGDVCRFIDYRGRTPEKTVVGLRLITAKNVKMGHVDIEPQEFVHPDSYDAWMTRGIPKKGDVLFTTEAPLANVAQLDTEERVVFAQRIIALQPLATSLDGTFLKYQLLSPQLQDRILRHATGATVQGIKASLLRGIEVDCPSLPEQQRIVAKLDAAFAALAEAQAHVERNRANARELFESYLNGVFVADGSSNGELRILGEIVDFEGGSQPPKSEFIYEPRAGYVRFLQIRDFKRDDKVTFIPIAKKNRTCVENDVLIGRYGASVGNILSGRAGAYNVALVKTKPSKAITRDYLYYYLLSRLFQDTLKKVADRSAQDGFSKDDIYNFPVPLPSISEQDALCKKFNEVQRESNELEATYQQKLSELAGLKKAVLGAAFRGEL